MLANIVIGGIVVLCVALAIRSIYRDHKRGAGCSCGCAGCSSSQASCHK